MTGPATVRGTAPSGLEKANLHAIHAWYLGSTKRVMSDPGLALRRPPLAYINRFYVTPATVPQ